MCGIIGFNWKDNALLKRSMQLIKNRGPDGFGVFSDNNISLGHNRLSIIDLSKAGKQPMANETETVWIIFNGEIYNYKELKNNLSKKHDFRSNTDTEVLIHLYEEEGFNMLDKLNGMFAFCIYDKKKNILFLARDRVGKKPLYYYARGEEFIFCSEIRGILEHKRLKKELNTDALHSYLIFRANTEEETFFRDINRVMPGNHIVYDLKNHKLSKTKYWCVNFSPESNSEEYYKDKVIGLLEDSVRSRLVSDVPYGVYLSGGVDSGTIAALVKKYSKSNKIKTFSVGFEEEDHVETKEARFLANILETDHHEILIGEDSVKALPEIIYNAGEPLADPTAIPIYFLSKYAKKYCTVILTGEGSDEIFAGYPQYKFMKLHDKSFSHLPILARKALLKLVLVTPNYLLDKLFSFSSSLGEKGLERFTNYLISDSHVSQYFNMASIFNQQEQEDIFKKSLEVFSRYKKYFNSRNLVSSCQKLEFENPMVEDLLMKVDKNTMAFGVEGRVPFLDHNLVELAGKIPESMKLKGLTRDKYILREAVKGLLPDQTRERKKKHFFVPIDSWFKNELLDLKESLLSEKYIKKQKIFNYDYIRNINLNYEKSKLFYSRQLWALIVFQIWYKIYIENEKVKI